MQEKSAPERTPEAKAQAGLDSAAPSGQGTEAPAAQPQASAPSANDKPLDVKVEGESDSKVYTSPNDAVSNDFLEGEE